MDANRFDALSRVVNSSPTRRMALWSIASLGLLGTGTLEDAFAKKKKKRKKKTKGKRGKPSKSCFNEGANDLSALDEEELAFLDLINDHRRDYGRGPLTHHRLLGEAAALHSEDMATNNYISHTSPSGVTARQRIINQGYTNFTVRGENIGGGNATALEAFIGWRNSPGHNENMLWPDFEEIGIGRAFAAESAFGWYWTTTFAGCKR